MERQIEMIRAKYENKIAILSQEIHRLNEMLKIKMNEVDDWRSKHSTLEISIHEKSGIEGELHRLKDMLDYRNHEIDEWRKKYNSLEVTIVELRSSQGKLFEYENKIALLSQEIERLQSMMKLRNEEIDEWKHKFYDLHTKVCLFYFIIVIFNLI